MKRDKAALDLTLSVGDSELCKQQSIVITVCPFPFFFFLNEAIYSQTNY